MCFSATVQRHLHFVFRVTRSEFRAWALGESVATCHFPPAGGTKLATTSLGATLLCFSQLALINGKLLFRCRSCYLCSCQDMIAYDKFWPKANKLTERQTD